MSALFKVKALFDYASPHEDDLSFEAGQVITVTEQDDDDWYGGEYLDSAGSKQEGIFPRNFVEKIEPTAPPRPTRTRTKKADVVEPEQDPEPALQRTASPPPSSPPADPITEPEPVPKSTKPEPVETPVSPIQPKSPAASKPPPPAAEPPAAQQASEPQRAPAQPPAAAAKPKATGPPPVAQKPSSNSFKDRIAAFNKADAAPITPFKPGRTGTDSFIKKPFVPPPPSRNAYVPPPTTKEAPIATGYRREEDPEIQEQEHENLEQAEKAGLLPSDAPQAEEGDDEDQPKPTSLKERIALLQKQQMEQAQRHAEAAAKKDKAKKPPVPKKRADAPPPVPTDDAPEENEEAEDFDAAPLQRTDTETTLGRKSIDDSQPLRSPPPPRRKSSKGPAVESPHDGNEADMSGAGDTTEGQDDASDHDDTDEAPVARPAAMPPAIPRRDPKPEHVAEEEGEDAEEEEQRAEGEEGQEAEEEDEDDVDPEIRRKEELRARMAKMSGGMGFHGMFGAGAPMPAMGGPPPKKKSAKTEKAAAPAEVVDEPTSRAAPPVPTPMALPGMGMGMGRPVPESKDEQDDDDDDQDEGQEERRAPPRALPARPPPPPARPAPVDEDSEGDEDDVPTPHVPDSQVPPVPSGRPVPPPAPTESRPPPPPPVDPKSATEGSQSDDELSSSQRDKRASPSAMPRRPTLPPAPARPVNSPPTSPRGESNDESVGKRNSRPPPPIPGSAPPPPGASRPPPPPPPGELSRQSTIDSQAPPPIPSAGPPQAGEEVDAEVTEYEGDYDTDIASSAPHKDALKAHARDSSIDDIVQSPVSETKPSVPPPLPPTSPRGVPPPLPSQPPPPPQTQSKRSSVDVPRAAPPPPPPAKDATEEQSFGRPEHSRKTPRIEEEAYFTGASPSAPQSPGLDRRVPPTTPGTTRNVSRQSTDGQRLSTSNRRSADFHRPSMDSGFIANDIDLAAQSGWWKQANQLPPYLQGRRDIYFESSESTTTNQGAKTVITREIFVLYQDYSQTIIRAAYDPYDPSDVDLEQRHEPPPRALRQDEMEEFYDRFGRQIADIAAGKKDSIVGDGTPHGFVHELLRPLNGALQPIGTRSFGALVYSNMANASTQQNDVIRPGDILSVRNGKFQGKHGPMHAKYSAEVGKPDHVAVVSEWDGTKKKVRVWEQGRENKKVKVESFKLDDLRSGEVKIWRVVPRSWVGWNSQP